tara:strand:+ start:5157 stop:6239 length:1083 start_codon:yes stop_codon:yes gene_type:complete
MTLTSNNLTEDLKNKIRSLVKEVVVQEHNHPSKHMIKEMSGRLTLACPYCGDSSEDNIKKRGNLYWDTLQFHCYNCDEHADLNKFLRDHDLRFRDSNDSINVIGYIKERKVQIKEIETLKHGIYVKAIENSVTVSDFKKHFKAFEISVGDFPWFYLKGRMLHHKSDEFLYSPKGKRLWILNKTPDDKILSCQSRQIGTNYKSKYLTYDMSKIYEEMNREFPFEEEEKIAINKISTLFNIMRVDMTRDLTIFEGPIDAMFMRNSLALATAGRSTEEIDEIPTVRYMFDNDKTGKKKMMEKLKKGKGVFMWSKFLKDNKLDIYTDDIKDLNDLVKKCYELKSPAIKNIGDYFTNSRLDALYI